MMGFDEEVSLTRSQVRKIEKRKAEKAHENPSNTEPIVCPECGCDYMIGLMKAYFTRSFAGNKITTSWSDRVGSNDMALAACPNCKIVYRINPDGTVHKTENYWATPSGTRKKK